MDIFGQFELFTRTFENRFIFNLFDLLLCGVILLVILRGWRGKKRRDLTTSRILLFLSFIALGGSFGLGAVLGGAFLFFRLRPVEAPFDLLIHASWASGWLLLGASALGRQNDAPNGRRIPLRHSVPTAFLIPLWMLVVFLILAPFWFHFANPLSRLYPKANAVLDLFNIVLLAIVAILLHRRPLGIQSVSTTAVILLMLAALLHYIGAQVVETKSGVILWNLEQFFWALSLFIITLAIGETGQDLFDKVFVRLQITFILLASVMILVITQTEKADYLASLRTRSQQLAEYVRTDVDLQLQRRMPLQEVLQREEFLRYVVVELGNQPDLKVIRVLAGEAEANFNISDAGEVGFNVQALARSQAISELENTEYFLIDSLPLLRTGPGGVELYGTREYLDQHIRRRVILIFSIFTAMVVLSTVMIGWVVHGASVTIRVQGQEIAAAQQQLIQSSKLAAIGQLASGVAHEINNPATTILSRASFLLMQGEKNFSESDTEDLNAIVTQAQRIAQITRGLLGFARPQALHVKPLYVQRVIDTCLRHLGESFEASKIIVERSLPPHLPLVMGDEDDLSRAFENLFRNAIDAMPGGGVLSVAAHTEGQKGQIHIEIRDTGAGISSENIGRIFEPFFTTKQSGKGTGLGLSIVHGIIREHGGSITVDSRAGGGARFYLTLPVERQR